MRGSDGMLGRNNSTNFDDHPTFAYRRRVAQTSSAPQRPSTTPKSPQMRKANFNAAAGFILFALAMSGCTDGKSTADTAQSEVSDTTDETDI